MYSATKDKFLMVTKDKTISKKKKKLDHETAI